MNQPYNPYAQQAPQAPAQQYAPQPQFAPQQPPAYLPQGFAPQGGGYAQQQGYGPQPGPQYPAPQAPQLATGTLDDFYQQPASGGGPALSFPTIGTTHVGVIAREMVAGDVQQQTDTRGIPQTFRDGRPKWVMVVPLTLPDGTTARWYVKGQAREALVAAMNKAGAPKGAPEMGAAVRVVFTNERQTGAGFNPAKEFSVDYARPNGAAVGPAQPPAPAVNQHPGAAPQPPVQAPPAPVAAPAPAPVAAQPTAFMPPNMDPAAAAAFAALTGQAPPSA